MVTVFGSDIVVLQNDMLDFYYAKCLQDKKKPIPTLVEMIKKLIDSNYGLSCYGGFLEVLEKVLKHHFSTNQNAELDLDGFEVIFGDEHIVISYNIEC